MENSFQHLFRPIKIGGAEIKNRIAMAPMGINALLNPDGSLGPRALDYYIERIRGGVGLIITTAHKVENESDPMLKQKGFPVLTYAAAAAFAELAEAAHAYGTKIFVQLSAGLGRVAPQRLLRKKPVSASATSNYWEPTLTCRELTTDEVERLVQAFGPAAQILAGAGIDGIELHGHEGYLFDQFTTPLWNRRTDKYGGDLAGRLTFPVEVLREIRRQVGQAFPVQYRFGLKHYIKSSGGGALPGEKYAEAGRAVQEGLQMAKMLEEAGFDALHVDAGCYESWYWAHPPGYQEHGCMIDVASEVKKVVDIPVIAVGRLDIPEIADKVIAEGKADLVALGRGLLSDPFWVKKVEEGQQKHIRPCVGCHDGCMGRLITGKATSCAVNPASGRERSYALSPTYEPQNVMIIGGGVAGMEAGRVAALRGHNVVIYEKSNQLGGHVTEVSSIPFKASELRLLDWYKTELEDLKVEIQLKVEVPPEFVLKKSPDVVIVATGSKPILLSVPGADKQTVMTACDLLAGKKFTGEKVVVVGGGLVGCETALWLAQQGKKVTIVEKLRDPLVAGVPIAPMNRTMLLDLLKFHKVAMITHAVPSEITDAGVVVIDGDFCRTIIPSDTVIIAVGLEPEQNLYRSLQGKLAGLYLIGDARQAKNIMNAVWDAYEVARAI